MESDYSDSMDEGDSGDSGEEVIHRGRRNIRNIKKTDELNEDTRRANRNEEERMRRIALREKQFQESFKLAEIENQLILDFDLQKKKPLVSVHPDLVKKLKEHQKDGVKFMWKSCYESIEQIKKSEGSGCIVAHCMGLGKTFQVIALAHTVLSNPDVGTKKILICCPKNTILNWVNEFKIWVKPEIGEVKIYNPTRHDNHSARLTEVTMWQNNGGVCIINYELIRILLEDCTKDTKQYPKRQRKRFEEALCNPGPELVICDEGHVLKNEETKLSKVMSRIKTLRRIILTGTPMQNNLKEYHCMVQFVKPGLLGSRTEFLNMFVNPILNGQYENSQVHDVQLMKERSHVLHKTLSGCVQRYDLTTLTQFLPEKQEFVIATRLTDCQVRMYRFYLDTYSAEAENNVNSTALFADHQALQRVWTHPYSLRLHQEKHENDWTKPRKPRAKKKKESCEADDDDSSSDDAPERRRPPLAWWSRFVSSSAFDDARTSTKLKLLLEIIKECENLGEKLLVFSGSLYSLSLIEHFLTKIDRSQFEDPALCCLTSSWEIEQDFFVMTGQTSGEDRAKYCRQFNNVHDTRARLFLISTKAGGIGINLTAANRAIIFDVSWNPSHDIQSIFRIYRLGQSKKCFVYRFVASGTMEEKIYERQVTKQSISHRVVDEKQIARHYTDNELHELYQFDPDKTFVKPTAPFRDPLLQKVLDEHEDLIVGCHEHDSLLEHKFEEELKENEKYGAWTAYIDIKNPDGLPEEEVLLLKRMTPEAFNPEYLRKVLRRKYAEAQEEEIDIMLEQVLPRVREVLNKPDLYEVMQAQAIISRNRRLPGIVAPQQTICIDSGGSDDNLNATSGPENSAADDILFIGANKSYFTTASTSKTKKQNNASTRSPFLNNSFKRNYWPHADLYGSFPKRKRPKTQTQPLKVWGSIAGREYGSPDRE